MGKFTYFPMRDWFKRIPCLSSRLETYIYSRKLHVFTNVLPLNRVNFTYLQMFSPSVALISFIYKCSAPIRVNFHDLNFIER